MNIGLTYDLRQEYLAAGFSDDETAEFDRPDTVAHIETALQQLGHTTDRIGHARQLAARLVNGETLGPRFQYCRRARAALPAKRRCRRLLDVYGIAYTFSDPLVMALTLHKGLTKTVVRAARRADAGFRGRRATG